MTVFAGWTKLNQGLVHTARPCTFHILNNLYTNTNGLREFVTGAPTRGIQVQTVEGHDHTERGGGAILPRGRLDGFDHGENDSTNGYMKEIDGTEVDVWYYADEDNDIGLDAHLFPEVTDGIHAGKNNNSSNPCTLVAHIFFFAQNDGGVTGSYRVRLKNMDTGDTSSHQTLSVGAGGDDVNWLEITDVPLNDESGLHRYKLQVLGTVAGVMRVFACTVFETRSESQPASSGSYRWNESGATDRP